MKKTFGLKPGEWVRIRAGRHKGQSGSIKSLDFKAQTVVVDGLNMKTKHVKADPVKKTPGYILSLEFPIHYSNVSKLEQERP